MKFRFCASAPYISSILPFSLALGCAMLMTVIPSAIAAESALPSSGLINPRAIAYNPATRKVYAIDTSHAAVVIYSGDSGQMRRVTVGAEPISIAVNPVNGRAYIANAGAGTVTVLDGSSDTVVATIPIGSHPYSIAVSPGSGKVYVTHTFGDQLSIIDGSTNVVAEVKTGSSDLIAINPSNSTVYLLGYGGDLKVFDESSKQFSEMPVGRHGWALTLNNVTGAVYVARIEDSDLAAIQPGSSSPITFPAGAIPCAIAVNASGDRLYVADYGDDTVTVIDTPSGKKAATIPVGSHPKAIAFDSTRKLIYVANTSDGTVTVIEAATNKVAATLPAGKNPYALAVVPGSDQLYVANEFDAAPSTVVDVGEARHLTSIGSAGAF
jgi:YVTN family beta-propeller protein